MLGRDNIRNEGVEGEDVAVWPAEDGDDLAELDDEDAFFTADGGAEVLGEEAGGGKGKLDQVGVRLLGLPSPSPQMAAGKGW